MVKVIDVVRRVALRDPLVEHLLERRHGLDVELDGLEACAFKLAERRVAGGEVPRADLELLD